LNTGRTDPNTGNAGGRDDDIDVDNEGGRGERDDRDNSDDNEDEEDDTDDGDGPGNDDGDGPGNGDGVDADEADFATDGGNGGGIPVDIGGPDVPDTLPVLPPNVIPPAVPTVPEPVEPPVPVISPPTQLPPIDTTDSPPPVVVPPSPPVGTPPPQLEDNWAVEEAQANELLAFYARELQEPEGGVVLPGFLLDVGREAQDLEVWTEVSLNNFV
jgi:hypothetical protein